MSYYSSFEEKLSKIRHRILVLEDIMDDYKQKLSQIERNLQDPHDMKSFYLDSLDKYRKEHKKLVKEEINLNGYSPSNYY